MAKIKSFPPKDTYELANHDDRIVLQKTNDPKFNPFSIDFLSDKFLYRLKRASRRSEFLARAVSISPTEKPKIIDATAGLGRDSFILASLGYEITMLERSEVLHTLLQDALQRAAVHMQTAPIVQRLQLFRADAIDWLKTISANEQPDVIYLDPMFPERRKSAAVKKEMQVLQELAGHDSSEDSLFTLALTCASQRVVVKRPRLAAHLAALKPNFSIIGNSNRFDVYIT